MNKGTFGVFKRICHNGKFFFNQKSANGGLYNTVFHDSGGGSVRAELLNGKVTFATDVIGPDATAKRNALKDGEAVLLENLRFHWEEEKKDEGFCKALAHDAEIYVNDAFGTAHRSHASTAAIVEYGIIKTAVFISLQ